MPDLIDLVRLAAEDKKGEELLEIPLAGKSVIADYFVIVSGRSKIQTRSIADGITAAVEEHGYKVARSEGYADGNWILLDLGSVVVHVFTPEQRQFYNLERLWAGTAEARVRTS